MSHFMVTYKPRSPLRSIQSVHEMLMNMLQRVLVDFAATMGARTGTVSRVLDLNSVGEDM